MKHDRPVSSNAAPGVHVGHLRFVTDHDLHAEHAQALGAAFTHELDAALLAARPRAGRLHIGELVIEANGRELDDRRALSRLAHTVAQRILGRTPE